MGRPRLVPHALWHQVRLCGGGVSDQGHNHAIIDGKYRFWHNFWLGITEKNAIPGTAAGFGQENKTPNTHNNQPRGANEVQRAGGPVGTTNRDHIWPLINDD